MTAQQSRKLTLGTVVSLTSTFELKKPQRHSAMVVALNEREHWDPLVTVRVRDGRILDFDAHWVHTDETIKDLLLRGWRKQITSMEEDQIRFILREEDM